VSGLGGGGEPATARHRAGPASPQVLAALRDYLLAPAASSPDAPPVPVAHAAPFPPALAVVAEPSDVAPLAAAVALLTATAHRSPCAMVVLHGARRSLPRRGPAIPAARRLAASLAGRGLDPCATGRLVAVAVGAGEGEGEGSATIAAAERAFAAAASSGAVAVAGVGAPLEPGVERVVGACDLALVLVRPGQERLLGLAVDGLAALGPPARGAAASVGLSARLLTARGLAVPPSLRVVLDPLVTALAVRA
jgi:hypothetical protein